MALRKNVGPPTPIVLARGSEKVISTSVISPIERGFSVLITDTLITDYFPRDRT
jgi:hypothetical protein